MKKYYLNRSILVLLLLFGDPLALAEDSSTSPLNLKEEVVSHGELLKSIKKRRMEQERLQRQREQQFQSDAANQKALLAKAESMRNKLAERYKQLIQNFDENETAISELHNMLESRIGSLGEISGTAKEVTENFISRQKTTPLVLLSESERSLLQKLENAEGLPQLRNLDTLWELNFEELTRTGDITFSRLAKVVDSNGNVKEREIQSVGPFLFFEKETEKFVVWNEEISMFEIPAAQPSLTPTMKAEGDIILHSIDPTFGGLLLAEAEEVTWYQRIQQGGVVALVILFVGLLGLFLGLTRGVVLIRESRRVKLQAASIDEERHDNSLGRVLSSCVESDLSFEEIEYRLHEQITKERMRLEWGVPFIKLCATVAPLLGLLGTVTGMIATFQSITVHGTSDPSLLAAGISQALVTTKVGLLVAIPLLFLHGVLKAPLYRVLDVLECQSAGMLARLKEESASEVSTPFSVAS